MCSKYKIVYDPYFKKGCTHLLLIPIVVCLIIIFAGSLSYASYDQIYFTKCLPVKYEAKIGICRVCEPGDLFHDCTKPYPVKGYLMFVFPVNGTNHTLTYEDLFCGNSINNTLANGKKNYPSYKWIKCGYVKCHINPVGFYDGDYPWNPKILMITSIIIEAVSVLLYLTVYLFKIEFKFYLPV